MSSCLPQMYTWGLERIPNADDIATAKQLINASERIRDLYITHHPGTKSVQFAMDLHVDVSIYMYDFLKLAKPDLDRLDFIYLMLRSIVFFKHYPNFTKLRPVKGKYAFTVEELTTLTDSKQQILQSLETLRKKYTYEFTGVSKDTEDKAIASLNKKNLYKLA